jgi:hypothetical protein
VEHVGAWGERLEKQPVTIGDRGTGGHPGQPKKIIRRWHEEREQGGLHSKEAQVLRVVPIENDL